MPPRSLPYLDEIDRDPGHVRVAFTAVSPTGGEMHAECVSAVITTVRLCEDLGHDVVEAVPRIDFRAMPWARDVVISAWVRNEIDVRLAGLGRPM
ncbi:MAG: hypothetical protein U1E45_03485 [Geminicoccaceae bacterium]